MSKVDGPKPAKAFYRISLDRIRESESFYPEFEILQKTVDAVNSFNSLYKVGRAGKRGGASTHAQQDLYRAMLIFACAGLDVLVKQLIKTKLLRLIEADRAANEKFKEYVKAKINKDAINAVALALIDKNPREILLKEYIGSMTEDSLQSVPELMRVSTNSGLDIKALFPSAKINLLKDAFHVRNQIIHEMDITISDGSGRTPGSRTRRQRVSKQMETHTCEILKMAELMLSSFQTRFSEFKIDVPKATG